MEMKHSLSYYLLYFCSFKFFKLYIKLKNIVTLQKKKDVIAYSLIYNIPINNSNYTNHINIKPQTILCTLKFSLFCKKPQTYHWWSPVGSGGGGGSSSRAHLRGDVVQPRVGSSRAGQLPVHPSVGHDPKWSWVWTRNCHWCP